jgi:hypothetical protein
MICFMTEGQQGTEWNELNKIAFSSFIPEKYRERTSFTWNFEDEMFSVNQDYVLYDGCIMTKECFVPEIIMPMPGLGKRFDEFIAILGYEKVNILSELPPELRRLLGLE